MQAELEQLNARLSAIRTKRIATDKAQEQAFQSLGESEHRDVTVQIMLAQADIAAKEQALADAQQVLAAIVDEGMDRLGQWPEHLAMMRLLVPPEDEATRILDEFITAYDLLLSEGPRVAIDHAVYRRTRPFLDSLSGLLWLEEQHIWHALNGREARHLRDRVADMRKLRDLHQEYLREKEGHNS